MIDSVKKYQKPTIVEFSVDKVTILCLPSPNSGGEGEFGGNRSLDANNSINTDTPFGDVNRTPFE